MKQVTKQPQDQRRLAAVIVVFTVLLAPASDRAAALTGAERMPPESFRFVAYVGDDYGYCTGAIIAPTWVLTAAHCVVKGDGSAIRPDEIGDLSRGWPDDDWERVPVKRVVPHPHYYWQGDGFRNDVALLETVWAFASPNLIPVEVLSREDEALHAANGTTALMIGYGEDENGQRDPDGMFRVVSAPLHHADSCRTEHSFVDARYEIVHQGTICAGDRDRGIRGGDSGGPLVTRTDDGTYGLIGIASISGHDRSGYPVVAVYTRVATVKDWIDGCVLGTGECVEGGVTLTELNRYHPDEVRESETLEQRSTAVIFVNETEKPLSYHWIDFNGNERYYGSVSPGDSISQHTYPGHVWAVKDANGRTFAIFVAEEQMGRAIVSGEAVVASQDGGNVEDARVGVDTDSAWFKVDVPWLRWVPGEDTDGGTPNLDEETTPGTWGASARDTIGRPWMYGGVWATYRAHNGDVVQVTVMGNAVYEATYSVAAWRVHGASGWGDWIYGSGPGRMGGEHLPSGPVTITQAGKLNIPFDDTRSLGDTERWWNTTSVMVIDDVAGLQTAAGCFHTCDAWQRASALAAPAVETDTSESVNDVRVADVTDELEATQVEKVIEVEADTSPDLSRDRVARVLDEALDATTLNVHGDEVPDWTTRLRAMELVIEFLGRTE